MTEYLLEKPEDYKAQGERLKEYAKNCPSPADRQRMVDAAESLIMLADYTLLLLESIEQMDEWVEQYAYDSHGFKF